MSHGYGPLVVEGGGEGKGEELTGGLAHLPVALWMSIFYDNVYSKSCMIIMAGTLEAVGNLNSVSTP